MVGCCRDSCHIAMHGDGLGLEIMGHATDCCHIITPWAGAGIDMPWLISLSSQTFQLETYASLASASLPPFSLAA